MFSTSEDMLTSTVDHLREGIWILDPADGVITSLNQPGATTVGRDRDGLIGTTFRALLEPRLSRAGWQLLLDQVQPMVPHIITTRITHPEQGSLPVELTFMLNSTGSEGKGSRGSVSVISRDLTEMVLANERAASGHELLQIAFGATGDGIALIDAAGRFEFVNEAFEDLVDLPHERIISLSIFDPPWTWLGPDGEPVNPESTAESKGMRTGTATAAVGLRLRGNGRSRSTERTVTVDVRSEPRHDHRGKHDGSVLILRDRTEQVRAREELQHLESIDPLTGLMSRSRIAGHTQQMIDLIKASSDAGPRTGGDGDDVTANQRVGVLHVDLDDFRSVNDTFGSTVGDHVLVTLAERFADLESRHVSVGRIGVDEFLIVATGAGASLEFDSRLRRLADEVQRRIDAPFDVEGLELRFTSSIGISRYPGNGDDSSELLRTADAARSAARRDGNQRLKLYDDSVDKRSRTSIALDRDLRRAAAERTLEVYYQPIIDLRSGSIAAAEALLRWHHPEHGPISPAVFIPTAEATGAISSISDMVISTVAEDLAKWNSIGLMPHNARIAINISSTEFEQRGFVQRLMSTIDNAGVPANQLELEITETLLMRDMEVTALRLRSLDDLGFLVALDDFGTGYSSLSYLHTLPLHTLKVDRCFVTELGNGRSETITKAILALAQSLGIGTVAEGVETDAQRDFLQERGCDMVQGYYYAPPLPQRAFEEFLVAHSPAIINLPAYS